MHRAILFCVFHFHRFVAKEALYLNKQRLAKFENQRPSKEARLSNFKIPFKRRKSLINYFSIQWATIKKFFIVYSVFIVLLLSLIVGATQFKKLLSQKPTEDELELNYSPKETKRLYPYTVMILRIWKRHGARALFSPISLPAV